MKIKREPMRLLAAVAAIALVAAACGSDDDSSDGGDTASTEASTEGTEASTDGDDTSSAECETANNADNSVASLTELDFSGIEVGTDEGWDHIGQLISAVFQRTLTPRT